MVQHLKDEVAAKNTLSNDQLYLTFIEPQEGAPFSPEGRVLEGKKRFFASFEKYKPTMCDAYRKYRSDPEGVTLAVGIATTLSPKLAESGLPLVPFSILAVRHGLHHLCMSDEHDEHDEDDGDGE